MRFFSEQFVNEQIKHLVGEKSSNPARSNPYKNFVLMIPFKVIFFVKKRYYRNEGFCLAWDGIEVSQNCPFTTTGQVIHIHFFLYLSD